jgi:hypothetical protein
VCFRGKRAAARFSRKLRGKDCQAGCDLGHFFRVEKLIRPRSDRPTGVRCTVDLEATMNADLDTLCIAVYCSDLT